MLGPCFVVCFLCAVEFNQLSEEVRILVVYFNYVVVFRAALRFILKYKPYVYLDLQLGSVAFPGHTL